MRKATCIFIPGLLFWLLCLACQPLERINALRMLLVQPLGSLGVSVILEAEVVDHRQAIEEVGFLLSEQGEPQLEDAVSLQLVSSIYDATLMRFKDTLYMLPLNRTFFLRAYMRMQDGSVHYSPVQLWRTPEVGDKVAISHLVADDINKRFIVSGFINAAIVQAYHGNIVQYGIVGSANATDSTQQVYRSEYTPQQPIPMTISFQEVVLRDDIPGFAGQAYFWLYAEVEQEDQTRTFLYSRRLIASLPSD